MCQCKVLGAPDAYDAMVSCEKNWHNSNTRAPSDCWMFLSIRVWSVLETDLCIPLCKPSVSGGHHDATLPKESMNERLHTVRNAL